MFLRTRQDIPFRTRDNPHPTNTGVSLPEALLRPVTGEDGVGMKESHAAFNYQLCA